MEIDSLQEALRGYTQFIPLVFSSAETTRYLRPAQITLL